MRDCNIRWNYLCQPALNQFMKHGQDEKQQTYLAQLSEQEQEIVSFSVLAFYMQQGGFLNFFTHWDLSQLDLVRRVLRKIGARSIELLLEQSSQIIRPVLQLWPGSTLQELLQHLTDAEKEEIYALDQAYQREEEQTYYQAFCYYSG